MTLASTPAWSPDCWLTPENRRAALVAAACLIGPAVPSALVVNRPGEAVTALTRMADLLESWLEDASGEAASGG